MKETPTRTQKPSITPVFTHVIGRSVVWVNCSQTLESLKLSKAVLPNSTATTATTPARGRREARFANGLRSTSAPSSRRPKTDRWPTSVE